MERINVTVTDEQKEWLDNQARFSASGLLQDAIRAEQQTDVYGIRIESPDVHVEGNDIRDDRLFESRSVDGHIGLVCTECDTEADYEDAEGDSVILTCPDCGRETTTVIR